MVRLARGNGGYGQSPCSCWCGEPLSEPAMSPRVREAIAARPHGVKPPRQLPPETPFVRRLQEQSQSRSMLKPTVTQVPQHQSRPAPVALEPPLLRSLPITQVANAKRRYCMQQYAPPRSPASSPRTHPQPLASLSSSQRPAWPFTTPAAQPPVYTTLSSFVSSSAGQPPFPPPQPAATIPPPPLIAELLEHGALQSPIHLPLPPPVHSPSKARGSEQRARPRVASHCTVATVGPWAAEKETRACGGSEPRTRGG